jgi:hypothetical protein
VVAAHGGRELARTRPAGGLIVEVVLPPAGAHAGTVFSRTPARAPV